VNIPLQDLHSTPPLAHKRLHEKAWSELDITLHGGARSHPRTTVKRRKHQVWGRAGPSLQGDRQSFTRALLTYEIPNRANSMAPACPP
jgi:hypothetical protein